MNRLLVLLCIAFVPSMRADIVDATSYVMLDWVRLADAQCGAQASQPPLAVASFNCVYDPEHAYGGTGGGSFSGAAIAQTRIGPYGLGGYVRADAWGWTRYAYPSGSVDADVYSEATASYSQDMIVGGSTGAAFMDVVWETDSAEYFSASASFAGQPLFLGYFMPSPVLITVPVEFGQSYLFTFQAHTETWGIENGQSGWVEGHVTSVSFHDAAGNPITGAFLAPVPEPAGIALLGTLAAALLGARFRNRRRNRAPKSHKAV